MKTLSPLAIECILRLTIFVSSDVRQDESRCERQEIRPLVQEAVIL